MITYRMRGLVNLHIGATTSLMGLLFLGFATNSHFIPFVALSPAVNVGLYFICVIAGMVASARNLSGVANRFHRLTWIDSARLSSRQIVFVALVIFTVMAATKDASVSRLFLASFLIVGWSLLLFLNLSLPRFLSRLMFQRHHKLPTLFVGNLSALNRLDSWLASKQVLGIEPIGFLAEAGGSSFATPYPLLGAVSDLKRVIDDKLVAQVIVLDLPGTPEQGRSVLETCQDAGCRVLIYNNIAERLDFPLVGISEEGHHFYTSQEEPLEDPLNRSMKRAFDIVLSLPVVVLVLPPLCLVVAILQRLQSPGRLFFAQPRAGHRRNEFRMIKFRSMFDVQRTPDVDAVQARKGDARIYPFGRILRRTSLDEFPQFLNVLKGDMSIVGPRPHMPVHDEEFARYFKGYRTRHFAKPGITGLAQIRGFRGEISERELLHKRVECDIEYITKWSIWLDLVITLKTVIHVVIPPKSAY